MSALLAVEHLGVNYGGLLAADDVSIEVAPGTVHSLIGPNGAGKTTLIDALSGFVRATAGRIMTPTLVIGGDLDVSMPWAEHGAVLAETIPGARSLRLPAAHISNLETPRAFLIGVLDFLAPRADDLALNVPGRIAGQHGHHRRHALGGHGRQPRLLRLHPATAAGRHALGHARIGRG